MIIFGTRSYFRTRGVTQQGFCENCGKFAKLKSFNAIRCFHLYFIPVLPTQGWRRNHKMCGQCNTGRMLLPETLEQLVVGLKERAADAVMSLQSGETTFGEIEEETGQPAECLPFLLGAIDWLYAAGEAAFCRDLISVLQHPSASTSKSMIAGSIATMDGKLDDAIDQYNAAAGASPSDPQPHAQAAHLLVVRKRRDEAMAAYQTALTLARDTDAELAICLQLAEQQSLAKSFDAAKITYERALEIMPSLINDKAFAKAIKRARKKSGS